MALTAFAMKSNLNSYIKYYCVAVYMCAYKYKQNVLNSYIRDYNSRRIYYARSVQTCLEKVLYDDIRDGDDRSR